MTRSIWMLAFLLGWTTLLTCKPAQAARKPIHLGGQLAYRTPHELRILGRAHYELTDTLSLMVTGGPIVLPGQIRGTAVMGPMLGFDVFTWVPRAYFLAGVLTGPTEPVFQVGMEVERYVSLHSGLIVGLGGEWSKNHGPGLVVSIGGAFDS